MKGNKIKTGIPGMDELLRGGLLPGRSILLSGPSGSGKSILAMQYIYNGIVKYNEPGLYVSFEEEKDRIIENMKQVGLDLKSLEKKKSLTIIGGSLGNVDGFMEKVGARPENIIEEIKEVIQENKIKRVVIDSTSLFNLLARDDAERRTALTRLTSALSSLGCTSLLTAETKEGTFDISRYGIEEFIVDGVIAIFHFRQQDKFIPGIVIRKMRGMNHEKGIRHFEITDRGIVVYPDQTMFKIV